MHHCNCLNISKVAAAVKKAVPRGRLHLVLVLYSCNKYCAEEKSPVT